MDGEVYQDATSGVFPRYKGGVRKKIATSVGKTNISGRFNAPMKPIEGSLNWRIEKNHEINHTNYKRSKFNETRSQSKSAGFSRSGVR